MLSIPFSFPMFEPCHAIKHTPTFVGWGESTTMDSAQVMLPNGSTSLDWCVRVLCGYPAEDALAYLQRLPRDAYANVPSVQTIVEVARRYFQGDLHEALRRLDAFDWSAETAMVQAVEGIWRARLHTRSNDFAAARQQLEGVVALVDGQMPEWRIISMVANWRLGLLLFNDGDMQRARVQYRQARALARTAGLVREEAMLDSDIATVYLEIHDTLRAIELFSRSADALAEVGEHFVAGKIRINIATTLQRHGHHAEAAKAYEDVMARSFDAYEPTVQFTCMMNLALCYKSMEQHDRAEALYSRLSGADVQRYGAEAHARLRYAMADLRYRYGDVESALSECALAQSALGDSSAMLFLEIEALRSQLLWQQGHKAEALDRMSMVFTEAQRLDHRRILIAITGDYASWLAEEGRYAEAYRVMAERSSITERTRASDDQRAATVASMRNAIEQERVVMKAVDDQRRAILSNVMPSHVADRLMAGEPTIAEQRDNVAVLFADIVNFSRLAVELPAKDLVLSLEALFRSFDDVMDHHGCEKIKTIGDSYMATAGTAEADVAGQRRRIIAAAIDMTRLVAERADGLRVRIGVHVGPAVVGVMGGKRMTYDVWGDTVNIAARMESTSEPGRIQASEAVVAGVDAAFLAALGARVTPRGIIAPKGIAPLSTVWIDVE